MVFSYRPKHREKESLPLNVAEITVEIWSDIACPWCYIGKRRFEEGLATYAKQDGASAVTVRYRSYQLAPNLGVTTDKSQAETLSASKGISLEQAEQMGEQVASIAKTVGLNYQMDKVQMVNTRSAHLLLHYALKDGKQSALKEALLDAYFVRGLNVADVDVLKQLAATVGIESATVDQVLADPQYASVIEEDMTRGRNFGVKSVPFFILNEKYGFSGAQDSSDFVNLLNKVQELEQEQQTTV